MLRSEKSNQFFLTGVAALLLVATVVVAQPAATSPFSGQISVDPDHGLPAAPKAELTHQVIHPDGLRNDALDCASLAYWRSTAGGSNRIRGNLITVHEDRLLNEFSMELQFTGQATLYFEVFGWNVDRYEKIAEKPVNVTGIGRAMYSSGEFNPPIQMTGLTEARQEYYIIAVAWSNQTIYFGSESQTADIVLDQCILHGSASKDGVIPPLGETLSFSIFPFKSYSMEVCFEKLPGACCLPTNLCEDISRDECAVRLGKYADEGITCDEIPQCPMETGACCYDDDSCQDLNEYACAWEEGEFKGTHTSCALEACVSRGACCAFGQGCFELMTEDECIAMDDFGKSVWYENETCDNFPCPIKGACCTVGNGCQEDYTEQDCIDSSGTWANAGTVCDPSNCPNFTKGACCLPDGSCQPLVTPYECHLLQGTHQGYMSTCPSGLCGETGACCNYNGSCTAPVTRSTCELNDGVFLGEDSTCEDAECTTNGACCLGDACFNISEDSCLFEGGTYTLGGKCDPNPCKGPLGGCCLDSECLIDNEEDCNFEGGTFNDTIEDCNTNCFSPAPVGACCIGETGCEYTENAGDCTALGGIFLGTDTFCTECSSGACCSEIEPCVQTRRDLCAGTFTGRFTLCEVDSCEFCDQNYPGAKFGDYNADGYVNYLDTEAIAICQLGPGVVATDDCRCAFDFDYDRDVDLDDYTVFANMYCSHCCDKHDWDRDGNTTLTDFIGFSDCMAGPGTQPMPIFGDTVESCLCVFDVDEDNDVDLADFITFQSQLNTTP